MNQTNIAISFTSLCKSLLLYTFALGALEFWAALLHIVKPIPLENLPVNFSTSLFHSWPIMAGMLWFCLAHILLAIGFAGLVSLVAFSAARFLQLSSIATKRFAISLWCLAIVMIWLTNQYYFPWSIFALLPRTLASVFFIKISLILLTAIAMLVIIIAMLGLVRVGILLPLSRYSEKGRLVIYSMSTIVTVLLLVIIYQLWFPSTVVAIEQSNKPNIIIIGIDSLRPDFTGHYGSKKELTPNIDNFLNTAVNFTNATTPLARTFPAWMSILTGEYPKQNGARLSLPDQSKLNVDFTLGKLLQRAGYKTIFAIDEQRFSNIDQHFGFDTILGPAMGFNDFALGTFNDFPFSNLWVNTRIGQYLFPYSHANRAANITYEPDSFNRLIAKELQQPHSKPLFLAIHLCLPHWPFDWAQTPFFKAISADQMHQLLYENSLQTVDQQFGQLMKLLAQHKLLKNTLVIVMSDHGQGLGLPGERLTPIDKYVPGPTKTDAKVFTALTRATYGHGTDVLNRSQYHIVFAVKQYSAQGLKIKDVSTPISLIDIMPTILDYLNLADAHYSAGISLLPLIYGPQQYYITPRSFYMETGLTVPGILIANPSLETALHQGLKYFAIQPNTGRVIVKADFVPLIMAGKQRAIITDQWLLARYPVSKNAVAWILVNLTNGLWTDNMNTEFAKQAPVALLLKQLELFYDGEIIS